MPSRPPTACSAKRWRTTQRRPASGMVCVSASGVTFTLSAVRVPTDAPDGFVALDGGPRLAGRPRGARRDRAVVPLRADRRAHRRRRRRHVARGARAGRRAARPRRVRPSLLRAAAPRPGRGRGPTSSSSPTTRAIPPCRRPVAAPRHCSSSATPPHWRRTLPGTPPSSPPLRWPPATSPCWSTGRRRRCIRSAGSCGRTCSRRRRTASSPSS